MFSIVIPLYNKENAIEETLLSVLAQTYTNFEVIVVDDGSKDSSAKVVSNIAKADPRIKLIQKENGGVSSARNRGIKEAKGEYIALLDGDDIWENTFLEEQNKLINEFPKASMWGVNYAFIKGSSVTPCNQGLPNEYRGYVENYWTTPHNDLFCSSSVCIRKKIFEKTGYFDERIHYTEDLDMWYRIILNYPIVYYDKVLVYYNQNADNRCAYDLNIHHDLRKCFEYYLDKYKAFFAANHDVAHYIGSRVANFLLVHYYFGSKVDREAATEAVNHLPYYAIHPKYRFIFQTPRWFGWIVYKLVTLKKMMVK